MTIEERINERLRIGAHSRSAHKNAISTDQSINDKMRDHKPKTKVYGESQEQLTDFSIKEMKELLLEEQIAKRFLGFIGQGKEANIYWIKDFKKRLVAIKMFRIHTTSHDYSEIHHRAKLSDTAKLGIATGLCHREYMYLHRLYENGVRVPRPYFRHGFLYGMEFLGDKYSASPLLRDVDLIKLGIEPLDMLDEILDQMDTMYNQAQIVHGDLSEHNIIIHDNVPYIIDVLQAKVWNTNYKTEKKIKKTASLKILRRDINSVLAHFKTRYRTSYDPDDVLHRMPDDKIEDWIPDELLGEQTNLEARLDSLKNLEL